MRTDIRAHLITITTPQFNHAQIKQFEIAFNQIDTDSDGLISVPELSALISKVEENLSPDELKSILKEMDCDSDGQLNFGEFLHMMSTITDDSPAAVLESFESFDHDNNGFVSAQELRMQVRRERSDSHMGVCVNFWYGKCILN